MTESDLVGQTLRLRPTTVYLLGETLTVEGRWGNSPRRFGTHAVSLDWQAMRYPPPNETLLCGVLNTRDSRHGCPLLVHPRELLPANYPQALYQSWRLAVRLGEVVSLAQSIIVLAVGLVLAVFSGLVLGLLWPQAWLRGSKLIGGFASHGGMK